MSKQKKSLKGGRKGGSGVFDESGDQVLDRGDPNFNSEEEEGNHYDSPPARSPSSSPQRQSTPLTSLLKDAHQSTRHKDQSIETEIQEVVKIFYSVIEQSTNEEVFYSIRSPTSSVTTSAQPVLSPSQISRRSLLLAEQSAYEKVETELNKLEGRNLDFFVSKLLRVSFEKQTTERIAAVDLLKAMVLKRVLTQTHCERAVEKFINQFEDIKLDIPDFENLFAWLITRGISDKWLHDNFWFKLPENVLLRMMHVLKKPSGTADRFHMDDVDDFVDVASPSSSDFSGDSASSSPISSPNRNKLKSDTSPCASPTLASNKASVEKVYDYLRTFKKRSKAIMHEYLAGMGAVSNGNVIESLKEIPHAILMKHEFVRLAVITAIDQSNDDLCELVSELFAGMESYISEEEFGVAFGRLLGAVDELKLDCPLIKKILEKFIVRAIADEVLVPGFLDQALRLKLGGLTGIEIINASIKTMSVFTTETKGSQHLKVLKIWNAKAAQLSDNKWRSEVQLAIREFFDSHDADEFLRICSEWVLDEYRKGAILRKLMVASMDRKGDECYVVINLIERSLSEGSIFNVSDLEEGLGQARNLVQDLKLDIPEAEDMIEAFAHNFRTKQIII